MMTRSVALAGLVFVIAGVGVGSLSAAPSARRFTPHQEPRGIGNLVVRGDRVALVYDGGVRSATGSVFVRNDVERRFLRLQLVRERGAATTLHARVPARLIRGHRLFYYAVLRAGRRRSRVPAAGVSSALILEHPTTVDLGTHRFGRTRASEAVVARARPDEVAWQLEGDPFGPQTFLVGADGSTWLDDSLNNRLLVYAPGRPDHWIRSVPLPDRSADRDVAFGPAGTIYVTGGIGRGVTYRDVLYRLSPTGQILWQQQLAGGPGSRGSFVLGANSSLRTGPDGTLYCLAGMPGLIGGEPGWMPVATTLGSPLSRGAQRRGTDWPYQPVGGGLRLVSELYVPVPDGAPHEARYALVDRRGRIVRAWRVLSDTDINFTYTTPELVGGDPVVVLDATAQVGGEFKWDRVVLRLRPTGATSFSLPKAVFGDNILADLRVGSDGKLYELSSSPTSGVAISRYALDG
jgi:hypothetical protein